MIKFPLLKEKEHYEPIFYEPIFFDSIAFPIIRRAFAHTLSSELVTVQPMELPNGLLHYIDYQYNRSVESINVNITLTNNKILKKHMVKFPLLKEKEHHNI